VRWRARKRTQRTTPFQKRADYEGRSLSNLMALLLEVACPE
jgi:hypothetical protein